MPQIFGMTVIAPAKAGAIPRTCVQKYRSKTVGTAEKIPVASEPEAYAVSLGAENGRDTC